MLIFPTPRIGICTIGGGATTTAAEGPTVPYPAETASTLGGGATTAAAGRLSRRDVVWLTEGGGATSELSAGAAGSCKLRMSDLLNTLGGEIGVKFDRPDLATLRAPGRTARRVRCSAVDTVRWWAGSF